MQRQEVDQLIKTEIDKLTNNQCSRAELVRQLLVAGIRSLPGREDFLRPYPEKPMVLQLYDESKTHQL